MVAGRIGIGAGVSESGSCGCSSDFEGVDAGFEPCPAACGSSFSSTTDGGKGEGVGVVLENRLEGGGWNMIVFERIFQGRKLKIGKRHQIEFWY